MNRIIKDIILLFKKCCEIESYSPTTDSHRKLTIIGICYEKYYMCSRDQFWYQQTVWLNNLFVNSTYNILVEWYFCLKICWQQHDSLHQCIYHVYTFINLCFYKMPKQWEHLTWLTKVLIFFQFSSLIFQVVLKVVRWKLGSCSKSLVV